ncbi:hypothetical protein PDJAM_G00261600 [Pangasius djambal]|nr:hypothetical protein [Pangasius djambal]
MSGVQHQPIREVNNTYTPLYTDLITAACCTLFFFVASVVLAALSHKSGAEIAAVIFGFVAMLVFGVNTGVCVKQWRLGDQRPLQTSEYTRARTASRGEVETRPE